MSIVRYTALLEAQPEGGFTVTFRDIPEAITEGNSKEEALFHAADVLTLCLEERIDSGDALPVASKVKGGTWVETAAVIGHIVGGCTKAGKSSRKPHHQTARAHCRSTWKAPVLER
jgi:predicted RNase H-like HicB family nuclease